MPGRESETALRRKDVDVYLYVQGLGKMAKELLCIIGAMSFKKETPRNLLACKFFEAVFVKFSLKWNTIAQVN